MCIIIIIMTEEQRSPRAHAQITNYVHSYRNLVDMSVVDSEVVQEVDDHVLLRAVLESL